MDLSSSSLTDYRLYINLRFSEFIKDNYLILILLFVLVLFSGFFSSIETAISASNKIKIKNKAEEGNTSAKVANNLVTNFDKTITAILIGNNIVNIAMASIATLLALHLGVATTIVTIIITCIVIIFGEVIPKSLAKKRPEGYTIFIAKPFKIIYVILNPLTMIFVFISKQFTKMFSLKKAPTVTEDDVYTYIESLDDNESLDDEESNLLYSAFEFKDILVGDIYTPKRDMVYIDIKNMNHEEIVQIFNENSFSRYPVCDGSIDNVIGILRLREYIDNYRSNNNFLITDIIDPTSFVSVDMNLDSLLNHMRKNKIHMTIIKDDNNKTIGLATMEDLLEELVGEIWDEKDNSLEDFKRTNTNTFEIDANLSVISAFELMEYDDFDREECGHQTLESWISNDLNTGEKIYRGKIFYYERLEIKVIKMRSNKIAKVEITVTSFKEVAE